MEAAPVAEKCPDSPCLCCGPDASDSFDAVDVKAEAETFATMNTVAVSEVLAEWQWDFKATKRRLEEVESELEECKRPRTKAPHITLTSVDDAVVAGKVFDEHDRLVMSVNLCTRSRPCYVGYDHGVAVNLPGLAFGYLQAAPKIKETFAEILRCLVVLEQDPEMFKEEFQSLLDTARYDQADEVLEEFEELMKRTGVDD